MPMLLKAQSNDRIVGSVGVQVLSGGADSARRVQQGKLHPALDAARYRVRGCNLSCCAKRLVSSYLGIVYAC